MVGTMPESSSILNRRVTAFHEAGHVFMGLRFGFRILRVEISRNDVRCGRTGFLVKEKNCAPADDRQSPGLAWASAVRNVEQRCMLLLAGPLAEAKALGKPLRADGSHSDLKRCHDLCVGLAHYRADLLSRTTMEIPEFDPAVVSAWLRRKVRRILGQPKSWRAISALADDLAGWGWLSGADAADTVQWALGKRNQLTLMLPMPPTEPFMRQRQAQARPAPLPQALARAA